MQRVDGPTRSVALPAPAATGSGTSSPGYFSDGDPVSGVPATTVPADWFNMIQEELVAVVLYAGLGLDKTNHGQLLAALRVMLGGTGTTGTNVNGRWEKRAGGVIEQWGYVAGSFAEGAQAITFPIPFPNACENLQVTAVNASGNNTHDIWGEAETWTTQGASVFLNYVQANGVAACDGFMWTAKGY